MEIVKNVVRIAAVMVVLAGAAARAQYAEFSATRVMEIAKQMSAGNLALAPACTDRSAWSAPGLSAQDQIVKADSLVGKTFPEWSDDAYLDFSKTGSRERGQAMLAARSSWLTPLVLAECSQWKGAYLKTTAMVLDELVSQKSWTLPAHDISLEYFSGRRYFVELASADLAEQLATALYLLGDKLPTATRSHVMAALEERVFRPMRISYTTGKGQTWLHVDSNWNAVCLAGVTGAALAVLPDRNDRAMFVAAAEHYQQFYLKSFPTDGFEVEGIGYWNYGFANYAVLREVLWRATNGSIDLFRDPKVRRVAYFGLDSQMLPGVIAYYSDAHFGSQPMPLLMGYVHTVFGVGPAVESHDLSGVSFAFRLVSDFPSKSQIPVVADSAQQNALRTFYPDAGVLVARPRDGRGLAVTIKSMGNGPHSHNDVGSYAIGLGKEQPLGEPGGPAFYTAQTFSKDRFLSKLLNSYGHPVPVVDGKLQKDALKVHAPVLSTEFGEKGDVIRIDMTDAYDVPALKNLTRSMKYDRDGNGSVELSDNYVVSQPIPVEEAIISLGEWKRVGENVLSFTKNGVEARVQYDCPGSCVVTSEKLKDYGVEFTRIALKSTIQDRGTIKLTITPVP